MRTLIAVALATTLVSSTVLAADVGLAPGKPAGVKQAELNTTTMVLIGTGVVAAIAIGVASSSSGSPTTGQSPALAVTTTTI